MQMLGHTTISQFRMLLEESAEIVKSQNDIISNAFTLKFHDFF